MKNDLSCAKIVISEQAKNDIAIERKIEMVVLYAIEHGIQYTSDFVQFLADDTDEESAEDIAEILDGFAEESAEYAFDKIDEKSALAKHIQALKDAMKNSALSQRAE